MVVEGIFGEPIGLNEIADRFKEESYKSPYQFADDMRSACNHAMNYDKWDEVVKVASRILDKVNENIEPVLENWKKLCGVDNEETAMDVDAGLGEKSDNTLVPTGTNPYFSVCCEILAKMVLRVLREMMTPEIWNTVV